MVVGLLILLQTSDVLASEECDSMDTFSDSMMQHSHHTVASLITSSLSQKEGPQDSDFPLNRREFKGRQAATATCLSGYLATSGGCHTEGRGHSFHISMPVGDPPIGWTCVGDSESIFAVVLCTRQFSTTLVTATSENWAEAQCPDGYHTTGAGCHAEQPPQAINMDKNIARCGGHGGQTTAYAVCTNATMQMMTSGGGDGGDWETPACPWGWELVGGGCTAFRGTSNQLKFQTSMPAPSRYSWGSEKWMCGGHGSGKQVIAICFRNLRHPWQRL